MTDRNSAESDEILANGTRAEVAVLEARLAEALKFLGHDAREGHSSTLALLELQRLKPDPMTSSQLAERIEANVRKALAAIDAFTEVARARSQPLRLEEIDFIDLLVEVVADAWPIASRSGIRIQVSEHPEVVLGQADQELLHGALSRLLGEAVARSVRGDDIGCALREDPRGWVFEIDAPGEAVASDAREVREAARPAPGQLLAQVVAQRHLGEFHVTASKSGRTVQCLLLPVPLKTPSC